ncbi:hypothetical protein NMY22_g18711 [Coprinellus aureogranulatus]|nr:hypothetical protein NMY22_g18711 [Coprinellus aureogranulatus]
MTFSQSISTTSLLVVLNFAYAANAQIGYRRRATSPARIIAGCIPLLFFICAFILFTRRRRARRFQLAPIPRPHVGEQPYAGPQQYGPPGSPPGINANAPYMQQNYGSWQQPYTGQPNYPSQTPHPGLKPQEEQLPPYSKEKDFANQTQVRTTPRSLISTSLNSLLSQPGAPPNTTVQPPPPIHPSGQNADGGYFVGGFRATNSP